MDKKNTKERFDTLNQSTYHGALEEEIKQLDRDQMTTENLFNGISSFPRALFAGFWVRFIAYLIDIFLVNTLISIVTNLLVFSGVGESVLFEGPIAYLIQKGILIAYFTVMVYATNGLTVGKAIMNLQTVQQDGKRLSLITCFVREGIGKYIISIFPLSLLALCVVFSKKRQNFMDFFADTYVVSNRQINAVQRTVRILSNN